MKLPNASTVLLAALVILKASDSSVTATKLDGLKEKSEISHELENISFASSPTKKLLRANEEVVKNEKVRTDYFQKDKLAYSKQVGSDIDGLLGGNVYFGDSVATNDDGTIIVVGAPAYGSSYYDGEPGGVYVYQFKDDKWMEYGTIPRSSDLGYDVSISDDGKHIGIVTKEDFYGGSSVLRYSLDESSEEQVTWKNVGGYIHPCSILYEDVTIYPDYYNYGCGEYYDLYDKTKSIKFTPDGRRLVIGAKAALVLDYNVDLDEWELVGDKIVGVHSYGKTATINDDGNKVVIEDKDFAQLYELENNEWVKLGSPTPTDTSNLIEIDTNANCTRVATVSSAGEVRIYQFEILSGLWTQLGSALKGFSRVSMNKDGNHIAAGNDGGAGYDGYAGYAEMFNYNIAKDKWVQAGDTIRGETEGDRSGRIAISGNGERVIVGAPHNDDGGYNAGSVRAFEVGYYQTIQIVTNYDFDGKGKEWCLEPKKQKKNQPLQVRPCTSGKKKQVWFHDNLNRLRLFEKPWFCAVKKDRTFVVGKCKDQKTAEDAIIKFDSKIGSIYIEKPVGILRLGIDMRKNWMGKRARVYALASTNPSVDTWSFKKL